MKKKITNSEAFELATKLNDPEILGIKDTEFALAVYKNLKTIVDEYNTMQALITPSEKWVEVTKDAKEEEDFTKLKKVKGNKAMFETREAQIAVYNEALLQPFSKILVTVKIKNLKTRLSAKDLIDLEPMLKI